MPKVINKQSCPTCGRAANKSEISVNSKAVETLLAIYKFCVEKGRHEFKRDEIDHLIQKGYSYGNFGYWKLFGKGLVYNPPGKGKGYWGFNLERIAEFLQGKRTIYARVYKNPLAPYGSQIEYGEEVLINEVRNIKEFIDENREFIIKYVGEAPSTVGLRMLPKRPRVKKGQELCPNCRGDILKSMVHAEPAEDTNTVKVWKWKACPTCKYETPRT